MLASRQFEFVSIETRKILHHILHEFYFLHSIRAHEMFSSPFEQPNYSNLQATSSKALFNDEMEKAKIQYMYYGHTNPYQMHSVPPPPPPSSYHPGNFLPPSPMPNYPHSHALPPHPHSYQPPNPFSRGPPAGMDFYPEALSLPRKMQKMYA